MLIWFERADMYVFNLRMYLTKAGASAKINIGRNQDLVIFADKAISER